MVINKKTRIGKIIKKNPDALQTIVSLSPDFKRLLNPVLRKLVAGRTSISMASKMGKVTPKDFFTALEPLGFKIDWSDLDNEEEGETEPMPEYLKQLDTNKIVDFDVRKLIADGGDPLRPIQKKVKALNSGEALKVITDFEPIPLIKVLERQGFQSFLNYVDSDTIESYFYDPNPTEGGVKEMEAEEDTSTSGDWKEIMRQFAGQLKEIDVRHLEMPGPMMTILETLETLPRDKALYVYHKKVPVFLLSELKDRDYEYRIKDVQEGEVYLIIFKGK